ncbi:MAG: hypothetical protein EPO08_03290 [Rhodospirillaceae bacterium]|nr:MAG: hypothetical protein EPO08_03290 [Rhodospirillaceae bacterium]
MNDTPAPQYSRDPERALEDLRSEFVVLRRGIEEWQKDIEKSLPPNYSEHFDTVAKGIDEVVDKVESLGSKIDGIKVVPREAMKTVVEEGRKMFDELKTKMSYAFNLAQQERDALKLLVGSAQTQKQQKVRLIWAGAGGAIAGMILLYVLVLVLPFGLNTYIAAGILGEDRWHAGQALMQAGNPGGWNLFTADANLANANRAKVDACRAAAEKTKKEQSCTITISTSGE